MKTIIRVSCCGLLLIALTRTTFGHGFILSWPGDRIEAASQVPGISPHMFAEQWTPFNPTFLFADHGGVQVASGSNPTGGSIEFLGPLWYSDGSTAVRATSAIQVTGESYDSFGEQLGETITLTGTSNSPGSFPVAGDDAHSIGWILSGGSLPAGVYGFSYRAIGFGDDELPSVPLVVALSTPGFSGMALADAQRAVLNAALGGDFNRDGRVTNADVSEMLKALTDLDAYTASHDVLGADLMAIGDLNRDGTVTNGDIQPLLDLLANNGAGSIQSVPEPSGAVLAFCAAAVWVPLLARPAVRTKELMMLRETMLQAVESLPSPLLIRLTNITIRGVGERIHCWIKPAVE
jgi:hypothetical protein